MEGASGVLAFMGLADSLSLALDINSPNDLPSGGELAVANATSIDSD
jgi:hypothetical protein